MNPKGVTVGYAHQYAREILHRGRVFMEPVDFVPDWADKPRDQKFYPGAERIAMPSGRYPETVTLQDAVAAAADPDGSPAGGAFDLNVLGAMLLDSYGLTGRRLGVQANTDMAALPLYAGARWSRGTASGGGLYPVSVYWVAGPSGPFVPGVYHYSPGHHAVQQLVTGDITPAARESLGDVPGRSHDQFLVLGVKYWQNAFKYNSFAFHAVAMDVGTILATWQLWARPRGLRLDPVLWFDEERLGDIVGVDTDKEGIFAVVPLAWRGRGAQCPEPAEAPRGSTVRHVDAEKSRTVRGFEAVEKMHAATLSRSPRRPEPTALGAVSAETGRLQRHGLRSTSLPPPRPLDVDVRTSLRKRRSSFGRFESARHPTEPDALAAVLAAGAATRVDGEFAPDRPTLATLYVLVNHVEGIEPGAYRYDRAAHTLELVSAGPQGAFLQRNYFLSNYNLEQAAAVVVPAIRTDAVLDAVGDRGHRLVNATIGAVSQTTYTACAALGLGCGVALGFDNISYIERLGLEETGEAPLLIMMIGHERAHAGDYQYRLA